MTVPTTIPTTVPTTIPTTVQQPGGYFKDVAVIPPPGIGVRTKVTTARTVNRKRPVTTTTTADTHVQLVVARVTYQPHKVTRYEQWPRAHHKTPVTYVKEVRVRRRVHHRNTIGPRVPARFYDIVANPWVRVVVFVCVSETPIIVGHVG